ncbi:MAG: tetratricopeptide repeat protein, partial [Deltaproteobacteria bacterium]|nr:tetratricopeptide repeat protein [Deltaproteobacteria bacterium]MBW2533884.1 tetratricopeptide repeat protein [Deltaproteobacteria bacterium]
MNPALVALVLWTSAPGSAEAALLTAAAASGRPPECAPAFAAGSQEPVGASVWGRIRVVGLDRYCAALARGHARLSFDPAAALDAAKQADEALGGRAAPLVLRARAVLAQGDLDEALRLFERARKLEPHSVEQPAALHDLATVLRRAGKLRAARDAYRLLVPRAAMLPSRADRAAAMLEAAHVSLALHLEGGSPEMLNEAMAYLREAGRDRHHPYRVDVALSLALCLDRAGRAELADAVVAELSTSAHWAEHKPAPYLARSADELALRALALERRQPRDAARLWQRFVALPDTTGAAKEAAAARLE